MDLVPHEISPGSRHLDVVVELPLLSGRVSAVKSADSFQARAVAWACMTACFFERLTSSTQITTP